MIHTIKRLCPQSLKNIYHLAQAITANIWYGFPARRIQSIGVTGTDGKTTTVQMIARILEASGKKIALSSTINFKIADTLWVNTTKYTTLSSFSVQKFLRTAVHAGCEYAVLEISSHSLDQNRVWGIYPEIAVITNVTREHLDYHKTMDRYRRSKRKLFCQSRYGIVNAEMENPNEFLEVSGKRKMAYGTDPMSFQGLEEGVEEVVAEGLSLSRDGSSFYVRGVKFSLKLPGRFNVENALAAISVALSLNIDLSVCAQALGSLAKIPGRLEFVENDRGISVIIDYAVTPDALEKLYALVRDINNNSKNIIAVFGACGDRDRGKRPIMGEIVDRSANVIIVTNEDPYYEDPDKIIREVASGIKTKKKEKDLFVIIDRKKAIRKALSMARKGDIVVITGKGAEETMAIGKTRIPWNDRKVVEKELRRLSS